MRNVKLVWYTIVKEMEKKGSTRISITRKALKELEMKKIEKLEKSERKLNFTAIKSKFGK